jgi:type II secretory pathway pseudopilin PulG
MNARASSKAGFSLVEIALALLIAGIGLLSIFALFPAGLDMSKRAIDDVQVAMFAQEVFDGLRNQAITSEWNDVSAGWNPTVVAPAPDMWKNPPQIQEGAHTAVYEYDSPDVSGLVDYALRYDLTIDTVPGNGNVVYFRLNVWNGEAGSTNNPATFYAEIYNTDVNW